MVVQLSLGHGPLKSKSSQVTARNPNIQVISYILRVKPHTSTVQNQRTLMQTFVMLIKEFDDADGDANLDGLG